MTLRNIKEIEETIDAFIIVYDCAVKHKDHKTVINALEIIKHELSKLDENTIELNTEKTIYTH